MQCTHKCGVDCELPSTEEWETINNDLQPADIAHERDSHVKVPDHDIGAHSASCLPTDTGHNTLNGEPTLPQKPSPCASCSVVAKDVEETATPAAARRQKEEVDGDAAREQCGKDEARCVSACLSDNAIPPIRPSLRPDESPRRTGQCCEQLVIAEMSINPRRSLMLPPSTLGPWFVIVGFSGRCTCSQHEFAPSRNFKTHSQDEDGGNFAEARGVRQTFQMEGQLNCHIRVSRIHHGQAICPTRPESNEPCALCTAKAETSQDQRQSSCVTDPFVALVDRELQN